ncbi:MAG: YlbF family regulator [Syntrophomonadaceae bacterium]|nr:YlbF family regulator [Syntrophomonadaceae bacterium]
MAKEDIIKLAFDLGTSIGDCEEITHLKELQNRLNEDIEASALIIKYQDAKMKLDNKMNDGLIISKVEEDHIDILEQQLSNNSLLQEIMAAQEKFDNLMQAVYYAMNQAITGSCAGSCSSCNGCS